MCGNEKWAVFFQSHVTQDNLLEFNTLLDRMLASEISDLAVCSCVGDFLEERVTPDKLKKRVLVPLHKNGWFHHLISHWRHLLELRPLFNVSSRA